MPLARVSRVCRAGVEGCGIFSPLLEFEERYQISFWDALILAAESGGAGVVYTEDLNHGLRYGSVLVQNPFRNWRGSQGYDCLDRRATRGRGGRTSWYSAGACDGNQRRRSSWPRCGEVCGVCAVAPGHVRYSLF